MIMLCMANGDFDISSNGLAFTQLNSNGNDAQEIVQLVRNYMRWYQGEEPTEVTGGVPYFQQVFNKSTPIDVVVAILKSAIEAVPGINAVLSLSYTLNQRQMVLTWSASTVAGPITSTDVLMGLTQAQEANV